MGSAFNQLCPRYSGTLTWETFTFYGLFDQTGGEPYHLSKFSAKQTIHFKVACTNIATALAKW